MRMAFTSHLSLSWLICSAEAAVTRNANSSILLGHLGADLQEDGTTDDDDEAVQPAANAVDFSFEMDEADDDAPPSQAA